MSTRDAVNATLSAADADSSIKVNYLQQVMFVLERFSSDAQPVQAEILKTLREHMEKSYKLAPLSTVSPS